MPGQVLTADDPVVARLASPLGSRTPSHGLAPMIRSRTADLSTVDGGLPLPLRRTIDCYGVLPSMAEYDLFVVIRADLRARLGTEGEKVGMLYQA
ncbi:hypothetical protein JOL79_18905 [Microbispora sp. RL4-1S]|uniref:Uncharacterized protein n=1 Tax=Microbispora oryzae TaxID=2806554 RepID=A0A941AJ33_9ACTN|nr:hypothetical protein [Microbispora oryzae]MBP2705880.1 hypothetical protein [Microbispora oryzae]